MVNLVALNDIVIKHADILRLIKLDLHLTPINESNYEFSNTYALSYITPKMYILPRKQTVNI